MTPRITPGVRLQRAMDAALADAGATIGQTLEWDVDERIILDRAALAADRAEDLRDCYQTELLGEARPTTLTKLSAEIRQLDRQVVDLVTRVNVGVGPARSARHVRAANMRWKRKREA